MSWSPSPRWIETWYPGKWTEVAGNTALVETWKDFIRNGPINALVTGPSRTGKTRVTSLGIRALLCPHRLPTLDPCGQCDSCRYVGNCRTSHSGIFSALTGSNYSYYPIDCETVTPDELDNLCLETDSKEVIVYLDEVAALGRRKLEGRLLKAIDETPAIWIASAVSLKRKRGKRKGEWTDVFPRVLKGRFGPKLATTTPHPADLSVWIEERCRDWNITILDPEETIPTIVQRTRGIVGYVIHVLAFAATKPGRRLSLNDASSFNFETAD